MFSLSKKILFGLAIVTLTSARAQSAASYLDGLEVQSVENFKNPHHNQLSFSVGYFPFNAYYSGFAPGLSYTLFFSPQFAWDIFDAGMVFTIDKGLTSELADRFGVEPSVINRLKYNAATHLVYVFSYGKTVFFGSLIRYFRVAAFGGPALTVQSLGSKVGVSYGLRFETYASESFSLKAELKNITTLTEGFENHAAMVIGSTLSF